MKLRFEPTYAWDLNAPTLNAERVVNDDIVPAAFELPHPTNAEYFDMTIWRLGGGRDRPLEVYYRRVFRIKVAEIKNYKTRR